MFNILLIGSGVIIIGFVVFVLFQQRVRRKRNQRRRQRRNRILLTQEKRLHRRMKREILQSKAKRIDKQTVVVKGCFADAAAKANKKINVDGG